MSKTIYEELIDEMVKEVRKKIICETKEAWYFSISIDSTPDVAHMDQLTIIVRYVNKDGVAVERFLGFVEVQDHSGEALADVLWDFLTIEFL